MTKLTNFTDLQNKQHNIKYVETMQVKDGVSCDVYEFVDDSSRDLAIVEVSPSKSTPLQKVLKGNTTIEGYVKGKGELVVTSKGGTTQSYKFSGGDKGEVEVKVGEIMQWTADAEQALVFYEICDPPYQDGRYEDLDE